jgi:putative oxidoreductase
MTDQAEHPVIDFPPTATRPTRPRGGRVGAFFAALVYAFVALGLRLVMARVFFLSGQAKIEGPEFPIHLAAPPAWNIPPIDFTVILPTAIKASTYKTFETQYAGLPISSTIATVLFTYAEFVLPICLVLGFATRFASLLLLGMTLLLQFYVLPEMWWTAHIYWVSILVVLICVGPGALSIDAVIRWLYRRK